MLIFTLSAMLDATPTLAVLESSSRFLLTLGVGLFIAYVLCMIGANIVGLAHRQVTALTDRSDTTESRESDLGQAARIGEQAGTSVAVKREIS